MARDIEEFLRKAAERRLQQKGGGPQKRHPQQPPPSPSPAQPPQDPYVIEAVEAEVVEAPPVRQTTQPPTKKPPRKSSIRSQSVADHVESHIDTSQIAQHAAELGSNIANVREKVDARIHQRLDSDLSKLDDRPTVTDDPTPAIFGARNTSAADELHRLLQNPKSVGQAILIAEILKRPEFD